MYLSIFLLFILLLFLSAFFSGSEVAFLNLKAHNKNLSKDILNFSKKSKHLLIGLLFGNTIINICIAFLGAYFIHHLTNQYIRYSSTLCQNYFFKITDKKLIYIVCIVLIKTIYC